MLIILRKSLYGYADTVTVLVSQIRLGSLKIKYQFMDELSNVPLTTTS